MWVIVGMGIFSVVLGLVGLAFPATATKLNTRFSNARAKQAFADPKHWWDRPGSQMRFAAIAGLVVGVMGIIAGFVGGHKAH